MVCTELSAVGRHPPPAACTCAHLPGRRARFGGACRRAPRAARLAREEPHGGAQRRPRPGKESWTRSYDSSARTQCSTPYTGNTLRAAKGILNNQQTQWRYGTADWSSLDSYSRLLNVCSLRAASAHVCAHSAAALPRRARLPRPLRRTRRSSSCRPCAISGRCYAKSTPRSSPSPRPGSKCRRCYAGEDHKLVTPKLQRKRSYSATRRRDLANYTVLL